MALEHRNGRPLVQLYGPAGAERRGGTITFNPQDALGRVMDHREIEEGAVRVSLGLVSNFADVWTFREYARGLLL